MSMTTHFVKTLTVAAGAGLLAVGVAVPAAVADEIADFYKGKIVTLYVGYSAGGGYDVYSRTLARHIGRHIPGNPSVVVKNRPGAGSLVLANEVYNTLPQNGTVIANVGRGMPTEPLLGNKKARFDGRKFYWLGSMNNEVSVCAVWHTVPVNFWQDLIQRGAIMGGTGAGADTDTFPQILNNIFGTKMKLVTGYPGGNDINFAIERGELEGRCGWSWSSVVSTRGEWLKDEKIKIILQMSTQKHADLPNVPLVMDFATTKQEEQVLKLIYARQVWGRPYMAGPGVPKARGEALRAAFAATMKDEKFRAEAKKQKLELEWVDGKTVEQGIAELYEFPKEVVAAAAKAQTDKSRIEISKAVIPVETSKGKITALGGGGRNVSWEGGGKKGKVRVSGSGTELLVGGKKGKRDDLKVGMECAFTYQGSSAKKIDCGA
jgi:tripartite-type tricarboxylate transporter receptor subunit TctC